jgi:hypothetical protein
MRLNASLVKIIQLEARQIASSSNPPPPTSSSPSCSPPPYPSAELISISVDALEAQLAQSRAETDSLARRTFQQLSFITSLRTDLASQESVMLGQGSFKWEREKRSIIAATRNEMEKVTQDRSETYVDAEELQMTLKAAEEGWRSAEGEARCEREERQRVEVELCKAQSRSEESEKELKGIGENLHREMRVQAPMSEARELGSDGSRLRGVGLADSASNSTTYHRTTREVSSRSATSF